MKSLKCTEFNISSTLQLKKHIGKLLEAVESIKMRERIELGLHEALVNAVVHGNSKDPNKFLRVKSIVTPHWFVWQIQDQGDGIPNSQRVFCLPSELEAESGRGLFLIKQCFDDIRWSRKGNRLQLAVRRQ